MHFLPISSQTLFRISAMTGLEFLNKLTLPCRSSNNRKSASDSCSLCSIASSNWRAHCFANSTEIVNASRTASSYWPSTQSKNTRHSVSPKILIFCSLFLIKTMFCANAHCLTHIKGWDCSIVLFGCQWNALLQKNQQISRSKSGEQTDAKVKKRARIIGGNDSFNE